VVFDPSDPVLLADPYPAFAALRERAPVHWHAGLGIAVAVSHEACSAGRVWKDKKPAAAFPEFNLLHRNSLLENEPPHHTG
jgi:hypothetical protein